MSPFWHCSKRKRKSLGLKFQVKSFSSINSLPNSCVHRDGSENYVMQKSVNYLSLKLELEPVFLENWKFWNRKKLILFDGHGVIVLVVYP